MRRNNLKTIFSKLLVSKDFKILFRNFSNFSLFQLTNYLVPLITIPYIVHIIGAEKYGILSFVAAVIYYLQIIIDYGFNISGVQKLAANRTNRQKVSSVYSSIITIRLVLSVIMIIFLWLASFIFFEVQQYKWIYLFGFLMIPGSAFQSVWFYNGMEEMQYLNYTNLVSRAFYLVGIFLIIRESQDFIFVPLINSVSIFAAGIVSTFLIYKRFHVRYTIPHREEIREQLKDGWHVFVSNVAMNLYRNSNIFILGLLAPKIVVGYYSAGEKIIKVLQMIFTPITNVFYPFISRLKSENPAKSILVLKYVAVSMGGATFVLSLALIFSADWITLHFFGPQFTTSALVIKIAAFVIFFGTLNYISGIIFMLNFSMKKEFTISVIRTGVVNIFVCFFLSHTFSELGTAVSFILAESFLFINLTFYIYTRRDRWIVANAEAA